MDTSRDADMLLERARTYLLDAMHEQCLMHTRFGAAMDALGCLCAAGVADEFDRLAVAMWEAARYHLYEWPTAAELGTVIKKVSQLIEKKDCA